MNQRVFLFFTLVLASVAVGFCSEPKKDVVFATGSVPIKVGWLPTPHYQASQMRMNSHGELRDLLSFSSEPWDDTFLAEVLGRKDSRGISRPYVRVSLDADEEETSIATWAATLARIQVIADPKTVKIIGADLPGLPE